MSANSCPAAVTAVRLKLLLGDVFGDGVHWADGRLVGRYVVGRVGGWVVLEDVVAP